MFAYILLVFLCYSAKAQEPTFSVRIKLDIDGGDLANSLITITKNGAPDRVIDPSKSKYNVDLDLNAVYSFVFTKMGYITKTIIIDTKVPTGREKEEFAKFSATVELLKQPADQIITYSQPVGRIKYSLVNGDFDFDKDYTATAEAMVKKAEANPIPKPKPPVPNPRAETKPPPPQTTAPSNPIPVQVKQPEYTPTPPKIKPVVHEPEVPVKPIVKNKEEKIIQEDRKKIVIITINIDGVDYIYRKEEYSWGGLYFYKNGKYITEGTFEKETE